MAETNVGNHPITIYSNNQKLTKTKKTVAMAKFSANLHASPRDGSFRMRASNGGNNIKNM